MSQIITYSFCEPYLEKLAQHLKTEFVDQGKDLRRVAVVFGGKRPALFLKKTLAQALGQGFFPPQFFTIDQFMAAIVRQDHEFSAAGDLEHCYLLYRLAQKITPGILKDRENFSAFLPWAREILKFIEQLDLEMVEDQALTSVQANAQIGYEVPESINAVLRHIVALRKEYHRRLEKEKTYSRGYQYALAARLMPSAGLKDFDEVLFCNFFYFHRSEESVVKALYERGKATLIFQGDERRWPVLERMARHFGVSLREGPEPVKPSFRLKLLAGFDTHSQVALVRQVLEGLPHTDRTVVVVPQPGNIIPLLSEIASLGAEFNISLGYPLRRSSVYSLLEFLFAAQLSRKREAYYARDYLRVLRQPFVKNLRVLDDAAATRILVHKIEEVLTGKITSPISGSHFLTLNEIEGSDDLMQSALETIRRSGGTAKRAELASALIMIHDTFFRQWEATACFRDFSESLERLLDVLARKSSLEQYPLNLNIIEEMYRIKDELSHCGFEDEPFTPMEMFRIFDSQIRQGVVAFQGSPLKGLQVLGLLETRSLHFENVIVMDTNERTLPALNVYEPLIPRDVMVSLNLDRLELEEEIQRYQFMRLISSAKNVFLVYQESKDQERSRFIEELVWDRQKAQGRLDVEDLTRASFKVSVSPRPKSVAKTPAMIDVLRRHSFSASSLNAYLQDPYDFYERYVLGLQEADDLLDEPEARQVGTFLHELLEEGFGLLDKKAPRITPQFRKTFARMFEEKFDKGFLKSMKSDSFLLREVLKERLGQFLDREEKNLEERVAEVLFLEKKFNGTIPLSAGEIKFTYVVDRVDLLKDGSVLVLDYKTGSVDQMPKSAELVAAMPLSRESVRDNVKSFQVPLYYYFLGREFPEREISAGLYSLRSMEIKAYNKTSGADRDTINRAFLRALDFVIAEILDPSVPFTADEK